MKRKNSKKSNKNKKSRKFRNKRSHKRSFGSMYGLQGGNTHYTGVYPMLMDYRGELPNLYNVARDYSLNHGSSKH